MRRSGEVGADFVVGEAETGPYALPYGLLSRNGERHRNAVEGHPVDEPFPILPLPPWHRVSESAVIEEEPLLCASLDADFFVDLRQHVGHFHRIAGQPRNRGQAVVLEIVVQSDGNRVAVIAANDDLAVAGLQFEAVGPIYRVSHPLEAELFLVIGYDAACQGAHRRVVMA